MFGLVFNLTSMQILSNPTDHLTSTLMKNYLYIILAVFMAIAAMMPVSATGQTCTPDTQYTTTGFYPSVLPALCTNIPYNEAITVVIPTDSTVNFPPFGVVTLTVDSVVVNNVTDLPTGITYSCNPSNCSFVGGSTGCILLSGTPTTSGTFGVDLDVSLYLNFAGNSVVFPATLVDTIQLNVNPELSGTINTTPADCGVANGTASVTVTSPAPVEGYLWSTGDTTASVSGLNGGSYTVTVSDTNGCVRTFNVSIGQASSDLAIDSAASVIDWTGCAEGGTGMVAPIITGTGRPFTFSWSNATSDSLLSGVPGGSYTLTVTDANGCVEMQTYEVEAPDTMMVDLDGAITDVDCNGEATGAAAIMVSGGDGSYTYSWNTTPAQTTASATGLAAGIYTATVTDGNGCTKTLDATITEPMAWSVTLTATDESVQGANDGSITTSVSGATPPYTFNWNGNDTTADLSDLTPGTYDLIITDSLGCTYTETVSILAGNPSSVQDLEGLVDLRLFPNPNQGSFSLSLELDQPKVLEVVVMNVHGQELIRRLMGISTAINEEFELSQKGIYLVQIKSGAEVATIKVLVK